MVKSLNTILRINILQAALFMVKKAGRGLHVHVSLPPKVVIITTYEPDPKEWIDCRVRR
jgi:crotonobetainyl-CoA:carnitine CoA-transferase CaiB-like acyl-CoA transferase